jgi:uroporphyrinogen decarboxylase
VETMNSKQRVLAALNNELPDKVPIYGEDIDEPVLLKLADILGLDAAAPSPGRGLMQVGPGPEMLDLYIRLVDELGLDATSCSHSIGLERIDEDHVRDKYGCVYLLSEYGEPMVVQGPIENPSDLAGYDMVSKLTEDDFAGARHVIDTVGEDKAHFMGLADPFRTSWVLRGGMERYLPDYVLNPGLVHKLMRITTDFTLAVIDMAAKIGVDALLLLGDLASETTTLVSPRHFREYVKPYHKEIVDRAHQMDLKIVKHSDGNVWSILDDFLEVGFDGVHPIQPQCMDIAEVKEHMGGRACILGNIDCRNLLPFGSEEEVAKVVKETIEVAAPGGGYIICSSNSIHPGCKAENYIAMIHAAHRYGEYKGGS